MKLLRKVGVTSEIWQIFIADSTSTTGAGLTGLVFDSAGLTAYYHRDTDTTATAITLATMTVGTFTSGGFKEIDSTNMPGWYAFCPPNAALASGAKSCAFHLKGAASMAPLPIEVDLQGDVNVTHVAGTAQTAGDIIGDTNDIQTKIGTPSDLGGGATVAENLADIEAQTDDIGAAGAGLTAADDAIITILNARLVGTIATGTHEPQTGDAYGVVNSGTHGNAALKTLIDAVQADLPQRITKNTALSAFPFFMVDSADHVSAKTGLTVTATRSLDGAAFASCANAVSEIGSGWYKIDLAAGDLNGNTVGLKFAASGADTRNLTLVTQPT